MIFTWILNSLNLFVKGLKKVNERLLVPPSIPAYHSMMMDEAYAEWLTKRTDHVLATHQVAAKTWVTKCIPRSKFLLAIERENDTWHEVIPHNLPCSLYLDIEYCTEAIFQSVLRDVNDLLKIHFGLENPECIIQDSCRPEKFSVHVTYPTVIFATPGDAGRFLKPLFDKYQEGTTKYLDGSIYRENSLNRLRMPYCVKFGGGARLVPRGGSPVFHLGTFKKCLASCTVFNNEPSGPVLTYGTPGSSVKRTKMDPTCSETRKVQRVLAYLQIILGEFNHNDAIKSTGPNKWQVQVDSGLYCPIKASMDPVSSKHGSNTMYLGSEDGSKVYLYCNDDACKRRWFFPEDFTWLLRDTPEKDGE